MFLTSACGNWRRRQEALVRQLLIVCGLAFALLLPMKALAGNFTINNINLAWTSIDPAGTVMPYNFSIYRVGSTPYSFDLNPGESRTDNLYSVYISDDYYITKDATASMNVTFDFTSPAGITDTTITGSLFLDERSDLDRLTFTFPYDSHYVFWGPNSDGKLKISLFEEHVFVSNYSWNSGYIKVNYEYVQAPTTVPEPTFLLLLAIGLGVVGSAAWCGRKKPGIPIV
jgi:hypothetical protein